MRTDFYKIKIVGSQDACVVGCSEMWKRPLSQQLGTGYDGFAFWKCKETSPRAYLMSFHTRVIFQMEPLL